MSCTWHFPFYSNLSCLNLIIIVLLIDRPAVITRSHEYSRMRVLAIRSTEDKMVATNPRVVSYFSKILMIYQFKPQHSSFWRTRVPFKFLRIVFYKPLIIKRIERQSKSNSELSSVEFSREKNTLYNLKHPRNLK